MENTIYNPKPKLSNKPKHRSKTYPELTKEGRVLANIISNISLPLSERLKAQKELYNHHGIQYKNEKINRKYIVWLRKQH